MLTPATCAVVVRVPAPYPLVRTAEQREVISTEKVSAMGIGHTLNEQRLYVQAIDQCLHFGVVGWALEATGGIKHFG